MVLLNKTLRYVIEIPSNSNLDFRGNCRKTSIAVSENSKIINVLLFIENGYDLSVLLLILFARFGPILVKKK